LQIFRNKIIDRGDKGGSAGHNLASRASFVRENAVLPDKVPG